MSKLVPVQINDADYGDDRVVIEAKNCWVNGEVEWAVPAWEEMGLGQLEGTFPDRGAATSVLRESAEVLRLYGMVATF